MILLDDDEEDQFSFDDYLLASRSLFYICLLIATTYAMGIEKIKRKSCEMGPMVQFSIHEGDSAEQRSSVIVTVLAAQGNKI